MTRYPTQSHYPDSELISPRPILLMLRTRLGRDNYQFCKSLKVTGLTRQGIRTFDLPHLKPALYRLGYHVRLQSDVDQPPRHYPTLGLLVERGRYSGSKIGLPKWVIQLCHKCAEISRRIRRARASRMKDRKFGSWSRFQTSDLYV